MDNIKIDANLRKAQMVMLTILIEFDKICEKHKIMYWIDYGTLLGAIRHKGFIPWDDDIDISIPRKEYNRLLHVIESELPETMFFQTKKTDPTFCNNIARIRDKNSIMHVDYYKGEHSGIFIDIFPVDTINENMQYLVKPIKFFLWNRPI